MASIRDLKALKPCEVCGKIDTEEYWMVADTYETQDGSRWKRAGKSHFFCQDHVRAGLHYKADGTVEIMGDIGSHMTNFMVVETLGNEVKALGDGRVAGYLVRFTDQNAPDLTGDFFDARTDFDAEFPAKSTVYYQHGLDGNLKRRKLGSATLTSDDVGVWVEAQLKLRDEYERAVYALAEEGKLGWSSGTAPNLVEREPEGKAMRITHWPLGLDASLTPTPAEPRNMVSIKSLTGAIPDDDTGNEIKATEPEAGSAPAEPPAIEEPLPFTEVPEAQEIPEMDATEIQAAVDSAVKAALAAQPVVNEQPIAMPNVNKTGLGDTEVKAFAHYLRTGDAGGIKAYNNTDMNIGTPADGGYAVPTGLYNQIIARRDEMSLVPKLGLRNIPGKGLTVNVPIDAEADVLFTSVAEAGNIGQDAPAISQKAMTLVKYGKYITLSWELLRDEDASLMAFVNDWVARGVAATENSLLITEALANGTAGLTLDAAAAIGAGEIPELEGKLMPEYQDGAAWIMHPTTYSYLRQLFGTSQFTFNPGFAGETPGFGYPVHRSSYATALGASAKSLLFGNFNFMGFRQGTSIQILNDPYTAAATGQTRMWFWFDAVFGVLQAEAIQYATHPSA
jgi:HK97 family phage major capsid protein